MAGAEKMIEKGMVSCELKAAAEQFANMVEC